MFVMNGCLGFKETGYKYDYNITIYYGTGCPHCARTMALLNSMKDEYRFNLIPKEVYYNPNNARELSELYKEYNVSNGGVPTILIGKMMIIGEMPKDKWELVMKNCRVEGICPEGYYWSSVINEELFKDHINASYSNANISVSPTTPSSPDKKLTWSAVILGAMADSINPCTIAVLAMLLTTILLQSNRKKVIIAGLLFTTVVYIMYFLMGLGILKAIESIGLQMIFFLVMTILALIITILEFNAYFNYKPGMVSIEMPMIFRPYVKKILAVATSYPAVALAAMFCSLFLLPCSSGPYLVILSLLAQAKTVEHITYLAVYNFVFVLPMLIITLIVGGGLSTPEQVQNFRDKHIKHMHLIAGILMGLLTILLFFQLIGFFGIGINIFQ